MVVHSRAATTGKTHSKGVGPRYKKERATAVPGPLSVSFPIVVVGASVGGLRALSAFLKASPARSGMAVVVVQHLAACRRSTLTQLLAKASGMPVREAQHGTMVELNHIYLIPPGKFMTLRRGALVEIAWEHPSASRRPVDECFSRLARDGASAAMGVILPAAGSDAALQPVLDLQEAISRAQGSQSRSVHLELWPLPKSAGGKRGLLAVLNPVPHGWKSSTKVGGKESQLKRELADTRRQLISLLDESAEADREELQTRIEELLTVNDELLLQTLDRSLLTSDLNNMLAGVDIPALVLDGSLRIRRFTPAVERLLKLDDTDIGRPFRDFASALQVPDWDALVGEVLGKNYPVEREIKDKTGRWFSLRIRPCRTSEDKIDGVMVILFDTDLIQRQLSESRNYASMLLDSAEQGIVAAGPDGTIVLVNGAAERMFRYSRAELLGKTLDLLLPAALEGRRRDGSIFALDVTLSSIDQAGIKLNVAFIRDATVRRRLEAVSETYRSEIRALAAQLITAQEDERRRVSRELHDSLCQELASLALDVDNLAAALPSRATTRARLRDLRARAVEISEEARHIAYELHPSVIDDLGLAASLKALCEEFSQTEKIQVDFTAGQLPDSIPQKTASSLYRIAQESMHNVAKHAQAKRLSVAVAAWDHSLMMSLKDDGIGFAHESVMGKGGLGLVGIAERARMIGGSLSIDSRPGAGTQISVRVPASQDRA